MSGHQYGEKVARDCRITSHERQPGGVPGTSNCCVRAADRSGQSLMPGCQHRGERRDVLDLPLHDRLPMFPFGATSFSGTILLVSSYTLEGITDKVKRPALIAASEGEAHWHDQSGKVCDAIPSARTRDIGGVHERRGFRRAGQHCEAKALGHRSRRIFDWPDETLDLSRNQPPTSDAHASRRSRHLNAMHANALAGMAGACDVCDVMVLPRAIGFGQAYAAACGSCSVATPLRPRCVPRCVHEPARVRLMPHALRRSGAHNRGIARSRTRPRRGVTGDRCSLLTSHFHLLLMLMRT